MLIHWIWFSERKLSSLQKRRLLEHFRDPEEIYYAGERLYENSEPLNDSARESLCDKDLTTAQRILDTCNLDRIRVLPLNDSQYPTRLRSIADPPAVLYVKGMAPDWQAMPVIGVVGTRKATPYGYNVATQMSKQIAACGGLVVSGGAAGIDTAALTGALEEGKPVVAVLGCGVDVVYPKSNRALFDRVAENGCLLSEYPPGTEAFSWHFPERNRIIAGISNGLLVVEAPEKSGALITARHALEQGRDVFSVPGNLGISTSAGSNALLQEGAKAVLNGWDVIREYAALYPGRVRNEAVQPMVFEEAPQVAQIPQQPRVDKKSIDNREKSTYSGFRAPQAELSEDEQTVLACIGPEGILVDHIMDRLDMNPGAVKTILTKLALKQCVIQHPGGRVTLK